MNMPPHEALDPDQGLTLSLPAGPSYTLRHPGLRALDLRGCPTLEVLDLRASQQPELHLSVISCPLLRCIHLPQHGQALVHLDTGSHAPSLTLSGGLIQIDACWQGGRFMAQSGPQPPWQQALIGLPWQQTIEHAQAKPQAAILTVLLGATQDEPQLTLGPLPGHHALVLSQRPALRELSLQGLRLTSLSLQDAPRLEALALAADVQPAQVQLSACPRLHSLTGPAPVGTLQMHTGCGGAAGLTVAWRVQHLVLADSRATQLHLAHPADVQLLRCSQMDRVELPPGSQLHCEGHVPPRLTGKVSVRVDESTLSACLQQLQSGAPQAWTQLQILLPLASSPRLAPGALGTLARAAAQQVPAEEVWHTRLALYARNQIPAGRQATAASPSPQDMGQGRSAWRWKLLSDLAADGWRADVMLVLHAIAAGLPDASQLTPHMARDLWEQPEAATSLLPWLTRRAQLMQPACLDFLLAHLAHVLHMARQHHGAGGSTYPQAALAMLETLRTLGEPLARRSELASLAHRILLTWGQLRPLLEDLAASLPHHPVETRLHLVQLQTEPEPRGRAREMPYFRQAVQMLLLTGQLIPEPEPHPFPHRRRP